MVLGLTLCAPTAGVGGLGSAGQREGDGLHRTRCREEGKAKQLRAALPATTDTLKSPQHCNSGFQMPLHYPRYKREDYEKMEEWKLDVLLREYGLSFDGLLHEKRAYAMGTFLWPNQL